MKNGPSAFHIPRVVTQETRQERGYTDGRQAHEEIVNTRGMQITNNINKNTNLNTLRCYYTPTRMSEIKTSDNANNIKAMKKRN